MYINTTNLIRHLGLELGITHSFLEISTDFMLEVIELQTLPLFSKYFPAFFRFTLDTTDDILKVEGKRGMYRIPTELVDSERILGVSKLITDIAYGTREGYLYSYDVNVFDRQFRADMASVASLPITFIFHQPNLIEIYPHNFYYRKFLVEIKLQHDKNLFTIPKNLIDEFYKLAIIDVKRAIYNIRKNFPSISTAFGNLEFDLDSVQGMDDKKQELLEKWDSQYYKSPRRKRLFVG